MKKLLLTSLVAMIAVSGFSQTDKYWSVTNESRNSIIADKATTRLSYPKEFKLFNLNLDALKQQLFSFRIAPRPASPVVLAT